MHNGWLTRSSYNYILLLDVSHLPSTDSKANILIGNQDNCLIDDDQILIRHIFKNMSVSHYDARIFTTGIILVMNIKHQQQLQIMADIFILNHRDKAVV